MWACRTPGPHTVLLRVYTVYAAHCAATCVHSAGQSTEHGLEVKHDDLVPFGRARGAQHSVGWVDFSVHSGYSSNVCLRNGMSTLL